MIRQFALIMAAQAYLAVLWSGAAGWLLLLFDRKW